MSDNVITVESVSKRYLVGHMSENKGFHNYVALRDVLAHGVQTFARKTLDVLRGNQVIQGDAVEEFWALKDVSFEVKQGEVLGIIGRNGAGKSTLLKILSRITEPTHGRVELHGRVASLLEVGTGFHPELTGRENIFLNGAILGMRRREIRRKFDEIVDFAEVERFLDTPVKRYSSGMYVRLAFAVAAHLEPEILIIDEVLAVGDAKFQAKCLGKISGVARSGRTVIFVSHNMRAVQSLCTSAILLRNGTITMKDLPQRCAEAYLQLDDIPDGGFADLAVGRDVRRRGSGLCMFTSFELLDRNGRRSATFAFGESFSVRINVISKKVLQEVLLGFSFITNDGIEIMGTAIHDDGARCDLAEGTTTLECEISPMILTPGKYVVRAAIFTRDEAYDHIDEIMEFEILDVAAEGAEVPQDQYVGLVHVRYKWKVDERMDLIATVS